MTSAKGKHLQSPTSLPWDTHTGMYLMPTKKVRRLYTVLFHLARLLLTLTLHRYAGACVGLPPVRTLSIIRSPPQTAPDPSICARNPCGRSTGLVGPMDLGSATKRVGAPAPLGAGVAGRRYQNRDGGDYDGLEGPQARHGC